jgi:hypothetical protein
VLEGVSVISGACDPVVTRTRSEQGVRGCKGKVGCEGGKTGLKTLLLLPPLIHVCRNWRRFVRRMPGLLMMK